MSARWRVFAYHLKIIPFSVDVVDYHEGLAERINNKTEFYYELMNTVVNKIAVKLR
jgi:hypothetical protein